MSQMSAPENSPSHTPITPKQTEPSTSSRLAADYRLIPVRPDELQSVWQALEPWMLKVVDGMNGRHTMAGLVQDILQEELFLWAVVLDRDVRAVVGADVVEAPSGLRSVVIRFCVGKKVNEWVHLLDEVEDWARATGADRIETWARKGWAKHLPDYKMTHVLLEKDL